MGNVTQGGGGGGGANGVDGTFPCFQRGGQRKGIQEKWGNRNEVIAKIAAVEETDMVTFRLVRLVLLRRWSVRVHNDFLMKGALFGVAACASFGCDNVWPLLFRPSSAPVVQGGYGRHASAYTLSVGAVEVLLDTFLTTLGWCTSSW